ncbi:FtsX-like permease family protein [Sutcliffiella horikoshii]|uniref:ABC transporter permease n=1 Tax=Sutcliffiella horikoshii TaxID=79883 RepID=UPI00384F10DB
MFHYIKSSFRERAILFLVIFIILNVVGFGYIGALAVSDQMTLSANKNLEEHWRYQYDILVLPKEVSEKRALEGGWVPPQSNIASYGGISLEDLEVIRGMSGVETAAPLAIIGFYQGDSMSVQAENVMPGEFYLVNEEKKAFDGLREYIFHSLEYMTNYYEPEMEDSLLFQRFNEEKNIPEGFRTQVPPGSHFRYPNELLVVAIDPEAEERLFQLSESTDVDLSLLNETIERGEFLPHIPFLALRNQGYAVEESFEVSRIEVPDTVMEQDLSGGVENYLYNLPRETIASISLPTHSEKWKNKKVELFIDKNNIQENSVPYSTYSTLYKYSPLQYETKTTGANTIPTVTAKRFPPPEFAEFTIDFPSYRQKYGDEDKQVTPNIIGYYDAAKIKPVVETSWQEGDPVDIYTLQHSTILKDGAGKSVEPTPLIPIPLKSAYYPGAPDLLTSIEVAKYYYQNTPPLSSVRVLVEDVAERSEASQRKIEQVAQAIMEETGHHVEIMLGSAGGKVHIELEGTGEGEVGTVEEAWQQQGVNWSIEQQMNETNKWLFLYLLIICFIFIYTTITHSLLKRATEFSTLRSIGWPRKKIIISLAFEIVVLSSVGLLSIVFADMYFQLLGALDFLLIWGIFILVISVGYVTGSRKALSKSPRASVSGENRNWRGGGFLAITSIGTYVFHQVMRRPLRFGLLAGSLALTLFIGILFTATQQGMSDFLFLSVLGETIDLEIQSYQKMFIFGGLGLTIVSIFFLLYLNATERKKEFFIMRSIGWSQKQIELFLGLEASFIALTGSIVGSLCAFWAIYAWTEISLPLWIYGLAILVSIGLFLLCTFIISRFINMQGTVKDQHAA